ncbi:GNAT family N-acetyltransferase [Qaidamihabitans albus]|uniref:GNAT family N-acetyltransferase n=1 Tax=Qaidamihabitans albus TaxID=2795733 RepID=UPI001F1A873B|nr:GNAT family N-acetyltransferase [Qaidamihabitans albus]
MSEIRQLAGTSGLHDQPGVLLATPLEVEAAVLAAEAAARAAGVRVRELTDLADLEQVYRLYDGIWHPDPKNPPVTTELLRALTKGGNYVAGAYEGNRLLGACVGFFGAPSDGVMHSHIAGVSPVVAGRSVGFALKLHQRAWALRRGVASIGWTFDPLVGRNAYFNLTKLAAVPAEYLTNFYGGVNDGINGTDDTDRLLVRWGLGSARVAAACSGTPVPCDAEAERVAGAVVGLGRSADGLPVAGTTHGHTVLVAVPRDIERLRTTDPDTARRWRVAVRQVLGNLLAEGGRVTGFDRAGWYVVGTTASGEDS